MKTVFLDTETCGLCGPAITLQYAWDDGKIFIHEFWTTPIKDSLELMKSISENIVVGFNLTFDWFQIHKMWNMFIQEPDHNTVPEDKPWDYWAELEKKAIDGPCFKPYSAMDLMLHARKTNYQITMERKDIRIRKVPTPLAYKLAEELEKRVVLQDILFARRTKKTAPKWTVYDLKTSDDKINPHFKDVVLKFKASAALKALAHDALGEKEDEILKFSDISIPKEFYPIECKYAPYALSTGEPGYWKGAWPEVIEHHINHWHNHILAREYARKDVDYTRRLYYHFRSPNHGDNDSVLACAIASCRLRGYSIDVDKVKTLKSNEEAKLGKYPTAPRRVKNLILATMSPIEQAVMTRGTGRVVLEEIATWKDQECPFGPCDECNNTGKYSHPAAEIAIGVLEARKAIKRIELYTKLLHSGRLHASFKIIGTLSSRMSGTDDLSPHGIPHTKDVRSSFTLTFNAETKPTYGGDFDGFEITLAEAKYNDPQLRKDLTTKNVCFGCGGKKIKKGEVCGDCKGEGLANQKIHGLFGMALKPGLTYADVIASKGQAIDYYDLGKRGIFSQLYGGNENTLVSRLGVSLEIAIQAQKIFAARYPGVGEARKGVFDKFCSMRQPGGIGTKVIWNEPADYVESLFGFKRYFTLENKICKVLFQLANDPPKEWRHINIKVMRRDREQTASGATQSALYAAAFGIQSNAMRAAANHEIQSSGATITKHVQRNIWNIQPHGQHDWLVQPMNVHDEILNPTDISVIDDVKKVITETVEHYKVRVPLLKFDWTPMNSWGDK